MPPRKRAAATADDVEHLDTCNGPRVESFTVLDPADVAVTVTRCQECGAQTTK
jgi:hypothetical protein